MEKIVNDKLSLVFATLSILLFNSLVGCNLSSAKKDIENSSEANNRYANLTKRSDRPQQNDIPKNLSHQFAVDINNFWGKIPSTGVVKSSDGGKTWQFQSESSTEKMSSFLDNLRDIFFVDKFHGWLTGNGQTWTTQDGGETWEKVFDEQINAIFFYDNKNGWMSLGSENKLKNYKTQDGGKTWQPCKENTEKIRLTTGAFFVSPKIGWTFSTRLKAMDNGGYETAAIAKTEDGGCNWQEIWQVFDDPDIRYSDLFFINEKVGWFSTFTDNSLFQTKDGGKTWSKISIPNESAQIETFFFKNENEGWILFASLPGNPIFYKTFDGGKSWDSASKKDLIQSLQTEVKFPVVSRGLRGAMVTYTINPN